MSSNLSRAFDFFFFMYATQIRAFVSAIRDGDKPSMCEWYDNKNMKTKIWSKNNDPHRDGDKPAVCQWYENGKLQGQLWCKNGLPHRENKPARREFYESGHLCKETWILEGKEQREVITLSHFGGSLKTFL